MTTKEPDCPDCWAVIERAAIHRCNEHCRPPVHTGGGTMGDTLASRVAFVAAADDLHRQGCVVAPPPQRDEA